MQHLQALCPHIYLINYFFSSSSQHIQHICMFGLRFMKYLNNLTHKSGDYLIH